METIAGIGLADVQAVYEGAEGELWELVMGEQIHIGGLTSSIDLAERAEIAAGTDGVDLCCCNGAGMRFLVRFRDVAHMTGVDATARVVERGRLRNRAESLGGRIDFVIADVTSSGLPDADADFVWGEDAWCYVGDKRRLIAEAARIVRPGGTIAFTDWVAGPTPLAPEEADRFLRFMKFPSIVTIDEYAVYLDDVGCSVLVARDTGRFASHIDLYLNMLTMQLTYDALKVIGFDAELMQALGGEMAFIQQLAHEGKIIQGQLVARRDER